MAANEDANLPPVNMEPDSPKMGSGAPRMEPELVESKLMEPELRPWDCGAAVVKLQELLNAHGFRLRVDGEFGDRTENAVRLFQVQQGLRVDCVVGRQTWARLRATVQPGSRTLKEHDAGADVDQLQGLLRVHGYEVKRNGYFDTATKECVMAFQQRHQHRVDGEVDQITWRLLWGRPLPQADQKERSKFWWEGRRWF